ncbi:alginate export family protein [Methylomonas sp. LL1]|uniref:alginate export family protein n=1 Tax=Methylomonas sp. LL1 TaxID=2785785 RepID=UPI0018C44AB3|nr:alginate export family protein [Methylomonas sp. LL1]QPK64678.1 alginate export family protein [Methylomonas sp. LL1]
MMHKTALTSVANPIFGLLVASGFYIAGSEPIQAAEKKSYTKPAFAAFESQMSDALLGSDKYEKPVWNLHDALNLPKWLAMSLEQRTRYETQDGQFKANGRGGDQQVALQTDFWLQASLGKFRAGAEFLDARALGADSGSGVNNTHADTADFIQGYLAWADQNIFYSGYGAEVIAGRQTLNFGSRRLVARNAMRNTINSFTGVRLRLVDYNHWQFNGFVTMPVNRYPTAAADILDETHEFDEEDTHTWFSGGILEVSDLFWGINSDVYLYHLDEGDSQRNQTRNRRYFTPGMRFYLKPNKGQFDFQTETIGQFGTVRSSTAASNGRNQDHAAWYQHLDVGYTFDIPWSPRLAAEYDYASGDHDPNDTKDQRFDTLYGARRFEFGATGIYGAFARSNINTPGYRITAAPRSDVQLGLSHRFFWLAEDKDSWTTANLRDTSGKTDNFIGQQLEMTARWDFNSSLNFETGWAHLFKGTFAKDTANAPTKEDVDYFYVQSQLRF